MEYRLMTIWRGILRNNESDKRLPESPLKVINFGEDELAALQSVKTGVRMYIYCEGDELVRLCIVVNSFLKKNLIPEIVFSSKEDRDLFFKYFYNSAIAGQDIPCRTRDGRYVVAEFPGAPDRAWSGLRDTDKTIFDKLAGMLKVYIKPKLISYWEEEHQDQIDVVVYLKTISKDSDRDGLPYYSDYEDRYLKNYDTSPVIMLVKDEKALPRPEKVVYSKANIITLVNGITMTAPKTVDEFSLGLPKIKLGSVDESFFINLKFGEKREFVRLFLKLIWSRFAKFSGFKLPDEVDRMRFSAEVSKRNKMVDTFFETEKCITEYFMGNFNEIKTLLNNRQDVLLNIGLDEISKLSSIQQITFLPEDKLFQDVFFFIFGKEIFYLKIRGHDFDWLQNNIRQIAKELSVTGKGDDDIENSDKNRLYEEKLDLPEQYGTDNTKEIECKKIILERDSQAVSIFVPIGSKAMLEKVTRDGAEEKGIKYTDLQPGDVFEKDYWTYQRLVLQLGENPTIIENDSELKGSLLISESFRSALRKYLFSASRDEIIKEVTLKLKELHGENKTVYFGTLISWIDTIICPIPISYNTVDALSNVFKKKDNHYNVSQQDFIKAAACIKSRKSIVAQANMKSGEEKVVFVVKEIDKEHTFMVRGENVGRFCAIT